MVQVKYIFVEIYFLTKGVQMCIKQCELNGWEYEIRAARHIYVGLIYQIFIIDTASLNLSML